MPELARVYEEDYQPWELQPWDTEKSYWAFLLYYLPQKPLHGRRNLNLAYRSSKPLPKQAPSSKGKANALPKPDRRAAPSNWRRWASGENPKGVRKHFILIGVDGSLKTLQVPTWEQRAREFDKSNADHAITKMREEDQQMRHDMRLVLKSAFGKLAKAWKSYSPQGESLSELTSATSRMYADLAKLFDVLDALEVESNDVPDNVGEGSSDLNEIQKMAAITEILQRGMARQQQSLHQGNGHE